MLDWISVDDLDVAVRIWHPDAPRTLIAWHGLVRHGGNFAELAQRQPGRTDSPLPRMPHIRRDAQLIDESSHELLSSQHFEITTTVGDATPKAAVQTLGQASDALAEALIGWTIEAP